MYCLISCASSLLLPCFKAYSNIAFLLLGCAREARDCSEPFEASFWRRRCDSEPFDVPGLAIEPFDAIITPVLFAFLSFVHCFPANFVFTALDVQNYFEHSGDDGYSGAPCSPTVGALTSFRFNTSSLP